MKIAPRSMFMAQVIASVAAGTTQLGVQAWMFTNIPEMCTRHQVDGFRCPSTQVFGTGMLEINDLCVNGLLTCYSIDRVGGYWASTHVLQGPDVLR